MSSLDLKWKAVERGVKFRALYWDSPEIAVECFVDGYFLGLSLMGIEHGDFRFSGRDGQSMEE